MIKEVKPPMRVTMLDYPEMYDQFLRERGENPRYGSRAKGFLGRDGSIDVVIDKSYYLGGGIKEEQLPAIVEHERTELNSKDPAPHFEATISEYRHMYNNFGERGLREYHARLCNLYGGRNDTRNTALKTVLGK